MDNEPLRDQVGRALYEKPGKGLNWYLLSEERRESWRLDADRIIPTVLEEAALVVERWSLPTIQTPSMWLVDKAGIAHDIRAIPANLDKS